MVGQRIDINRTFRAISDDNTAIELTLDSMSVQELVMRVERVLQIFHYRSSATPRSSP